MPSEESSVGDELIVVGEMDRADSTSKSKLKGNRG